MDQPERDFPSQYQPNVSLGGFHLHIILNTPLVKYHCCRANNHVRGITSD